MQQELFSCCILTVSLFQLFDYFREIYGAKDIELLPDAVKKERHNSPALNYFNLFLKGTEKYTGNV